MSLDLFNQAPAALYLSACRFLKTPNPYFYTGTMKWTPITNSPTYPKQSKFLDTHRLD
ncbi:hypothetical protein BJX63DRAFT_383151 [Aspergillus granulosus]|uniref:Uncharacterized protein n=1 Tax=Aspergillus granulosus TaxID=176169 RepID=A0ABR4HTQ6_9EURO